MCNIPFWAFKYWNDIMQATEGAQVEVIKVRNLVPLSTLSACIDFCKRFQKCGCSFLETCMHAPNLGISNFYNEKVGQPS
jgi:hypothetical protein